jgi:hypothetical protein
VGAALKAVPPVATVNHFAVLPLVKVVVNAAAVVPVQSAKLLTVGAAGIALAVTVKLALLLSHPSADKLDT